VREDGRRRSATELLGQTAIPVEKLAAIWPWLGELPARTLAQLRNTACYAGYIGRQDADIRAFRREEAWALGDAVDYREIGGLSAELLGKLEASRPASLGAASRIQGMTPAALAAISAHLRRLEPVSA